jgi:hypothetical protein
MVAVVVSIMVAVVEFLNHPRNFTLPDTTTRVSGLLPGVVVVMVAVVVSIMVAVVEFLNHPRNFTLPDTTTRVSGLLPGVVVVASTPPAHLLFCPGW